jgi:putative aldouronate transport system permease protein
MAWGLTKIHIPGYKVVFYMVVITLFFNAGSIPSFLLIKNLGLLNSHWSLIWSGATTAWNLIVVRNFLAAIPSEMEESAKMDGCGDLRVFSQIILPLSKPAIATFLLFFSVKHWNNYFNALLYISDTKKWTLQLLIKQLVVDADASGAGMAAATDALLPPQETVRMASVILATAPILLVYPFLQKYFAKGVMMGSIKG